MRRMPALLLAGAVLGSMSAAGAARATETVLGTNPPGTMFHAVGTAVVRVLGASAVEARVQPFAGSGPLLDLVEARRLDYALVNVFELARATAGTAPFTARHPNLRIAAALLRLQVGFVVPASSPVRAVADLRGKRLPAGFTAQPIVEPMRLALLANAGLRDADVEAVPIPNTVRAADLMALGHADAAFLSAGSARVAELMRELGGVRFLPLQTDERSLSALREILPQARVQVMTGQPAWPGVAPGLPMLSYDVVLATHREMEPARVRRLVEILMAKADELAAAEPALAGLDARRMADVPGMAWHPAAQAALRAALPGH